MRWTRYRIVKDNYTGYECQIWRIYLPIWIQIDYINGGNTFPSITLAEDFISKIDKRKKVIKYID